MNYLCVSKVKHEVLPNFKMRKQFVRTVPIEFALTTKHLYRLKHSMLRR